jgi:nucleotide-binding universal stress UspA family protein
VAVEERLVDGVPHQAILNYVSETPVDLVVMGTHGQTGAQEQSVGSVAERVVRRSPVPVHIVPIAGDALAEPPRSGFR